MKVHLHRVANMDPSQIDELLTIYTNVEYIEGDLRCTADGILVMSHDNNWYGYPIDQHSYIFLNDIHFLPTFDRLIQYIKNNDVKCGLNIEIKADSSLFYLYQNHIILELCRQFETLERYSLPIPIIQCFDIKVLKMVSYFLSFFSFPCQLSYLIEDIDIYRRISSNDRIPFVSFISPDIEFVTYDHYFKKIKQLGYQILPWYNKTYSPQKSKIFDHLDGMIFDI